MNGEVRHEAENDGEPNQLSPSRGMILAAHVAENGGGWKSQNRKQHIAARDHGILVREPESEGQKSFQDQREG